MKVLRFILQKEFRQISRDKTILFMMFLMPTVQLIVFPLAMNFDVKSVNIAIIDHDNSSNSQKLISKIGSSGFFKITGIETSYLNALHKIEQDKADVVMEIPSGFERSLIRERTQKIGISIDAINGAKAAIGGSYLSAVLKDFNTDMAINAQQLEVKQGIIDVTFRDWYNPRAEYKYNIVPAILVILLTMIGGFTAALNIVKEKEMGTIEQINVTPIKKWEFILGKLIPFWIIGMVIFTIGLFVCWIVYGIVSQGSIPLLYLFGSVYLIALLGFGLLISTYCDSQVQAMFVAFFFMMIFMLMGGLFTSVESMPAWARGISNMLPITHFIKVVRMIMLKGSNFKDVQTEFLYLIAFGIFLNSWAIWNYRKTS